jgi:hypothetical protein
MDMRWVPETLESLHKFDTPWWAAVALVFGLAIIFKGPDWLKVILSYRNERRRVLADIRLKMAKADTEMRLKIERSQRQQLTKKPRPGEESSDGEMGRD